MYNKQVTTAGIGLRYEPAPWEAGALETTEETPGSTYHVPDWVTPRANTPAPQTKTRAPSELGGDKVINSGLTKANPNALRLGTAVHLLLETLPNAPQEN